MLSPTGSTSTARRVLVAGTPNATGSAVGLWSSVRPTCGIVMNNQMVRTIRDRFAHNIPPIGSFVVGMLFGNNCSAPFMVDVPIVSDHGHAIHVDDLSCDVWVLGKPGRISNSALRALEVRCIINVPLPAHFVVVSVLQASSEEPFNKTINSACGVPYQGNVLVLKRSPCGDIIDMQDEDRNLIVFLVSKHILDNI
ncbi:hypothetical protein HGRIS_000549 [Hohenbuehelia grisea]|uniref:Uncharacterized protein n=1 Tax=Hohenbuehelia grisea TaxID=104357 RepID=A0ABR3JTB2_9AGAR